MMGLIVAITKFVMIMMVLVLLYLGIMIWDVHEANKQSIKVCGMFNIGMEFDVVARKIDKFSSETEEHGLIKHRYKFAAPTILSSTECRVYVNNGIVVKTDVKTIEAGT